MAMRMAFLYTGPMIDGSSMYEGYTATDMSRFSGVTEFVICASNYTGFITNTAARTTLADGVASLVKLIYDTTGVTKKVWITTPTLGTPSASTFTVAQYTSHANIIKEYLNSLRSKIDGLTGGKFESLVNGVYMHHEHVRNSSADGAAYMALGSTYSAMLNHPEVYLYDVISKHARAMGKRILWCPYYGQGGNYSTTIEAIGKIANITNIFDYVFIQPGYYFLDSRDIFTNFGAVRTSAKNNCVVDRSGKIVSGPKTSSTQIGVQMEIDSDIRIGNKGLKYGYYEACFNNLTIQPSSTPLPHDGLARDTTSPTYVKGSVNLSYYLGAKFTGSKNGVTYQELQNTVSQYYLTF